MRIAVISDTHFGYSWETERREDPFRNARAAFEKARDADIILMPGDIFDKDVPRQDVLAAAMQVLKPCRERESTVSIAEGRKDDSFQGTPVVAIHGTHERRSGDRINPIELLEEAGFLIHLHNDHIVFEKDGERVAVHGMGGVPERYAPTVLQRFDPQPLPDAFNLLMIHQSVENFVYTDKEVGALSLEDLPDGFDYIIDGHIHWRNLEMQDDPDRPFIIPGSTITTQMNKIEADTDKSILLIDSETGEITIERLETTRDVYNESVDVTGKTLEQVVDQVTDRFDLDGRERKPLLHLDVEGSPATDFSSGELAAALDEAAIINVTRHRATDRAGKDTHDTAVDPDTSPTAMGASLLKEKLSFDRLEDVFDLLATGRNEELLDLLTGMDDDAFGAEGNGEDRQEVDADAADTAEEDTGSEPEDDGSGEKDKHTDTLQRFMQS